MLTQPPSRQMVDKAAVSIIKELTHGVTGLVAEVVEVPFILPEPHPPVLFRLVEEMEV